MTCPETIAIGAYVLGALDTGERHDLEQHLRDCPVCRDAALRFADLPGILHALTLEQITSMPSDLDDALSREHNRRALSRRRALMVTTAAVFVTLTGVVIGREVITDPVPQASVSVNWAATDGVGGLDTTANLSNQPWGTDIHLQLKDVKPGQRCHLVVHARTGESEITGSWTTTYAPDVTIPASTSIALLDITRLDVVTATGTLLTSLTPSTR